MFDPSSSTGDFVSRRRFADTEVAVLSVGTMHFSPADNPALNQSPSWSWEPLCEPDGRVLLGVNVIVVRTPSATIVVDPCTFDPNELTVADAVIVPGETMDRGLEALALDPRDVTHVLVTHAHEDHFSGILDDRDGLRFPNALHILPAADWRSIVIPGHPFAASAGGLRRRLPLSGEPGGALLVEGDHEVCEGITLIPTPGETEGHQIVRVQTGAGRIYVLGDLVHWAPELERPHAMAPTSSPSEIRRRVVHETQEEPSTLLFTHAVFPGWGTLTPVGPDTWRWEDTGDADDTA